MEEGRWKMLHSATFPKSIVAIPLVVKRRRRLLLLNRFDVTWKKNDGRCNSHSIFLLVPPIGFKKEEPAVIEPLIYERQRVLDPPLI